MLHPGSPRTQKNQASWTLERHPQSPNCQLLDWRNPIPLILTPSKENPPKKCIGFILLVPKNWETPLMGMGFISFISQLFISNHPEINRTCVFSKHIPQFILVFFLDISTPGWRKTSCLVYVSIFWAPLVDLQDELSGRDEFERQIGPVAKARIELRGSAGNMMNHWKHHMILWS